MRPQWRKCPECLREQRQYVLFKTRVPWELCFLHWLARNPPPRRRRT